MNAAPKTVITDDEFDRMVRKGLSTVLGRVELRDGEIRKMNAQHVPHAAAKMSLFRALDRSLKASAAALEAMTEVTVSFGDGFSPLPDVVVWCPVRTDGPIPGNTVRLIVEIADTTLADDLGPKQAAYAKAGLPEYWVVDLNARALHCFAAPKGGAYTQAATYAEGKTVSTRIDSAVSIVFSLPA